MRNGFGREIFGSLPLRAFLLVAVLTAFTPLAGRAQDGQVIDRARLFQNEPMLRDDPTMAVTGPDSSHAEASPNDPDLGEQAILKRQERYRAFTVSVATPIFYTSNVALARSGAEGDLLVAPVAGISYMPRLTRTLYALFSLEQQQFYYDRFDELDFGSFDARAGLTYQLPQFHDLLLRAAYNYNRLTSGSSFDGIFSDHSLWFSAELPFRIGRAQQVSLGTNANVSFHSDPEQPGRHDFDLFVAYSVNLTRSLNVAAVGRLALRDYTDSDRTDVSEILALNATYRFTKWLSASATTTFASSQSSESLFDYDVANVGAALALAYRF